MDRPPLIDAIAKLIMSVGIGPDWRRLRLAVTPAEYQAIREWCFAESGQFHGRIRDIPLVVDGNPMSPDLWVEWPMAKAVLVTPEDAAWAAENAVIVQANE